MNIATKTVGPQRFLCSTHRSVKAAQIGELAMQSVEPMCKAAGAVAILMTKTPVEFHYEDYDPAAQTMTLHICVPIVRRGQAIPPYTLREAPGGKFAVREFPGSLAGIVAAWDQFYKDVRQAGLVPTGESREVYGHWAGMDSPDNRTELLLGVQ